MRHIVRVSGSLIALLPLCTFSSAIGVSSSYAFLTYWEYPSGTQIYSRGDPIHIHAGYQLPPDWVMNVYATVDGKEYPQYVAISNVGETATRTGTLSWSIVSEFASGTHEISLTAYAAARCAFAATSTCLRTAETYRPNIVHSGREFVVRPVVLDTPSISDARMRRGSN